MKVTLRGFIAAGLLLCTHLSGAQSDPEVSPYAGAPGWAESKDERMEWFKDAKFGMFIHWGLYSTAGGYWPPSPPESGTKYTQHYAEWIRYWANESEPSYGDQTRPLFNPDPGCTTNWAALAKSAGMKYTVLTTKHHEGYTLFNSTAPYSQTNSLTGSTNISPPGRDMVGEYADSMRAEGLKVGYYYSLIDWQHTNAVPESRPWPTGSDHADYVEYMNHHVRQLFTDYGQSDILWVDYSSSQYQGSVWNTRDLLDDLRALQPQAIINNRFWGGLENDYGDFFTPEKYVPPSGFPGRTFEVNHTMNESYGYSYHDDQWKSSTEIVHMLVDIVSKGGNLLLNVGPDAQGRIPQESIDALEETGQWLEVNGEAIYETRASGIDASGLWGRMTMNKSSNVYYAIVLDRPADGVIDLSQLTERKVVNSISAERLTASGPVAAPITESNGTYTVNLDAVDLDSMQTATFKVYLDAVAIPVPTVTWTSAPAPVEGGSGETLSSALFNTNGLLIHAENCGGGAMSFDSISFAAGSTDFGASYNGFHSGSQLSSTATYGSDGSQGSVMLTGLTSGTVYRIQALMFDGRGETGLPGRTVEFDGIDQGQFANGVSGSTYGDGLLVTGTFTANASTQPFSVEVFYGSESKGGQLNALTVFDPGGTPEPPEPPPAVGPNLLVNGDFEDPVVSGERTIDIDTESTFITGWTLVGAAAGNKATLFGPNWDFWGQLPGLTNGQYASFNSKDGGFGDAIEQTFATSIGEQIQVSYMVGNGSFQTLDAAMQLDVTSEGGALGDLASQVSTHGSADGFTTFTAEFTATTTNTTIRFTDVSTGATTSSDTLLDQVSASAVSSPALPATVSISGPVSGGTALVIGWMGEAGGTYTVETNANLTEPSGWGPLATGILGTGGPITITNDIGGDQLFYRITTE